MAEIDWELKAVHGQLDVFETLESPYESFKPTDFINILIEVEEIKRKYMNSHLTGIDPRKISREIMKYSDHNEDIKLSFVIIITNKLSNGDVSKIPVFVIKSGNIKIFIDLNCTVFKCWEAYARTNDLPVCKFCFPVDGQYMVGERLKIDFASSPATLRERRQLFCKGLALVAGVGGIVYSLFFSTTPIDHHYVDLLLPIARQFVPKISEYIELVLKGVKVIERYRYGSANILEFLSDLCELLMMVNNKYGEDIRLIFRMVRESLSNLYDWIKQKLSDLFGSASKESQHKFLAVTCRIDAEINNVDSDIDHLNASRRNHYNTQAEFTLVEPQMAPESTLHWNPEPRFTEPLVASRNNHYSYEVEPQMAMWEPRHTEKIFRDVPFENTKIEKIKIKIGNKNKEQFNQKAMDLAELSNSLAEELGKKTAEEIFRNAHIESAIMQREMENKNCKKINLITMVLLEISNGLAKELGKKTLKDAQDIFEALGTIFMEEYRDKMEGYTKGVIAAKDGAKHEINLEAYNQSLGIKGDPKEHFQKEAIKSIIKFKLAYRVKIKTEELEKQKKILLFELGKTSEGDVAGLYRSVGISGAGLITVDGLVETLQEKGVELDEEMLVINETESMITIRNEYLIIMLYQELNSENTSHGMVLIDRVA